MSRISHAYILSKLFDVKPLWESRADRRVNYRPGEWFTVGTPLYLDLLKEEDFNPYKKKCEYFNSVLMDHFSDALEEFRNAVCLDTAHSTQYLAHENFDVSLPGFHIFPGSPDAGYFFGKMHRDEQWRTLLLRPDFKEWMKARDKLRTDMVEHMSHTLVLKLPFMGGGMRTTGEHVPLQYEEGKMYSHSGLFLHAIEKFAEPVLPCDWRITMQAHSFKLDEKRYVYW